MSGTVIGQVAALALSPIITRLFTPEDFTTLEQYTMMLTVLVVVVTGKYEFAIMQPKDREDARHVVGLATRVAFWSCLFLLILSFFVSGHVADYYQNQALVPWLWTLPITLFAFALFNIINYWFSRQKNYKVSATSKIWYSVASEPVKIVTGAASLGAGGLLLSTVAGNAIAALYCVKHFLRDEARGFFQLSTVRMKELAKEYKDYPAFTIWGSILNRVAQWAHIGMFSHYYGLLAIGYMALCRRVFMAPLNIVSNSYSQVFYQRISEITDVKQLESFYHKNMWRFLGLSVLLVVAVHLLPANTMGFIFGEPWKIALQYLQVLSFWYALNFTTSSLSFITYRIGMQRMSLVLDALHFVFVFGAIAFAHQHGYDELNALKALVVSKVLYFTLNIIVVLYYLRVYCKRATES